MDFKKAASLPSVGNDKSPAKDVGNEDATDPLDTEKHRLSWPLAREKTYGDFYVRPQSHWPDCYIEATQETWQDYYDADLKCLFVSFLEMLHKSYPKVCFDEKKMWGDFKNLVFETSPHLVPPY